MVDRCKGAGTMEGCRGSVTREDGGEGLCRTVRVEEYLGRGVMGAGRMRVWCV